MLANPRVMAQTGDEWETAVIDSVGRGAAIVASEQRFKAQLEPKTTRLPLN
jgi:hypothetical protein